MYGRRSDLLLLIGSGSFLRKGGCGHTEKRRCAHTFMSQKKSKTKSIAFGGVICALAVVVLFLSAFFPTLDYSLPAISGILLISVVIEYGYKSALLCFAAVSLLALLLLPNKEVALLFVCFFGYYPILKGRLEQLKSRPAEWLLKLLVLNAGALVFFGAAILLTGTSQLLAQLKALSWWILLAGAVAVNGLFVLFDCMLTRLIGFYYSYLKPRFSDKLNLH